MDLSALDDSLRAMCTYTKVGSPSYATLKAVFELGNFVVGTPVGFASIMDPQESHIANVLHLRNQKEFNQKYQWLQYKELRKGKPDKKGKPPPLVEVELDFTQPG